MRALLDFPDGFGADPSMACGPTFAGAVRPGRPAEGIAVASVAEGEPNHVPGPFRARYDSGFAPPAAGADLESEASGGFRPQLEADGEPVWREPVGIVVPTLVVGLILAAMGYFLDIW